MFRVSAENEDKEKNNVILSYFEDRVINEKTGEKKNKKK